MASAVEISAFHGAIYKKHNQSSPLGWTELHEGRPPCRMILKANSERQSVAAETRYIVYIMALTRYFVKVNVKVV